MVRRYSCGPLKTSSLYYNNIIIRKSWARKLRSNGERRRKKCAAFTLSSMVSHMWLRAEEEKRRGEAARAPPPRRTFTLHCEYDNNNNRTRSWNHTSKLRQTPDLYILSNHIGAKTDASRRFFAYVNRQRAHTVTVVHFIAFDASLNECRMSRRRRNDGNDNGANDEYD